MWESKYVLSKSKFWRAIILNIIAIFGNYIFANPKLSCYIYRSYE